MLDYIKIKVATKNVLWTLFMLDKLKYGKLIEPKTLRRYQDHASSVCLKESFIGWTNCIKLHQKEKHAKQETVRMFNEEHYSKKQNIHT